MLIKNLLLTLTLALTTEYALCGNVLHISGVASKSHHIWNRALALGLVGKGYNVTMIGPDVDKTPPTKNFSHILMKGVYDTLEDDFGDYNAMTELSTFALISMFQEWSTYTCQKLYNSTGLKMLWNYPKDFKFDIIVVDITTGPCLLSLVERFKFPPTVAVTPFLLPIYVSYNFGNHLHTSFLPWYNLPYTNDMSFTQRIWNWFFTVYDIYLRHAQENDRYDKMARETFGDHLKADWRQLERHITLVLSNTDPILDVPQPLTPNIIPVGGLHAVKSKPLPKDLQDLLDNTKHGVIVFSLGTNFRSDKLPEVQRNALIEAFGKLKELVIWKFESDIQNLPKNVVVRKFIPQNDLLGHPNVKLFIGHGGALSTQEAIFHGIPMIAVPFLFDQILNAKAIERRKFGVKLDLKLITTDYVSGILKEVLENPIYKTSMKAASERYRDQPSSPLERGIFWVEYAAKHNGAGFLNSPARDMSWIKSSNADIFAFLSLVALGIVLLLVKLYKAVFGRKQKVKTH